MRGTIAEQSTQRRNSCCQQFNSFHSSKPQFNRTTTERDVMTTTTGITAEHIGLEMTSIGALFAAIARLTDDSTIKGLAEQGQFLADSLTNDIDVEAEQLQ